MTTGADPAPPAGGGGCGDGGRPPLLRLDRVGKSFAGGGEALRDISLDIRQGDFVTLLGPSGCGKSTLLRLIAGLIRPSTGRLVWSEPEARHSLGLVFQDPTLMPWATVAENLWLPLRLARVPRREAAPAIAEALAMVGLSGTEDSYPRALSGGMRMRVSIARALITRPRLILMDEPFAALDEITRFRLNGDLLELRDRLGCTVVFVTHSVFEAVFLSERVAVMGSGPGRVSAELTIDTAYPRTAELRTSPGYAAQCRAVSHALAEVMPEPSDAA